MYRVCYISGNGYHCSCCRTTSDRSKDFGNEEQEQMRQFIINMLARETEEDNHFIKVIKFKTVDFKIPADEIKEAREKYLMQLKQEKEQKNEESKKRKEETEKKLLRTLKEKYETDG